MQGVKLQLDGALLWGSGRGVMETHPLWKNGMQNQAPFSKQPINTSASLLFPVSSVQTLVSGGNSEVLAWGVLLAGRCWYGRLSQPRSLQLSLHISLLCKTSNEIPVVWEWTPCNLPVDGHHFQIHTQSC